jgi:hypothetical protein
MRAAVVLALATCTACTPRALDVGANDPPPKPPAVEQQLRAGCAASPGKADRYESAADLTARLSGRWFACYDFASAPLVAGDGVELTGDGHWRMLDWTPAHDGLVPTADADRSGPIRYLAFSDADAGEGAANGGISSQYVALDDPTPWRGIFVYLERTTREAIVEEVDFESDPRKMYLREAGPSGSTGFLVPAP